MVATIRPHGAIQERLIKGVAIERPGRFAVVDNYHNIYGVSEQTYTQLLNQGYKEIKLYVRESNN